MASRARTQLRSGPLPAVQHEPEWSRDADAYLTERAREPFVHTLLLEREPAQHAIERFTGNLGPVLQSGTIVASVTRAIALELVNLIQERIHHNFTRLLALTSCRTPTQLFAAQRDIILDNVEGLVRSTGRIADVSMQVAHEGARRMSAGNWAPR
jgi:Phasin protein